MVSIFISSTFQDMQAERDALQRITLPLLAKEASRYGRSVVLTDLRWGVNTSELETAEGARKVLRACLREIDRCRPYMIVLLGERYGWMPEEALMDAALREEAAYQSEQGANYALLLENLEKSVTELEIEYGALLAHGNCFFYFREALPQEKMTAKQKAIFLASSEEDRKRMETLKRRISALIDPTRVRRYAAAFDPEAGVVLPDDFADGIARDLMEHFAGEWGEPLLGEGVQREAFAYQTEARQLSSVFAGRDASLTFLNDFVADEASRVLVLSSAEGNGKTTLLARFVTSLQEQDDILAVPFLCGYDRNSVTVRQLLVHFIAQMDFWRRGGGNPSATDAYAERISGYSLRELRAMAASSAYHTGRTLGVRVVLCIDGVERLEDGMLDWLPTAFDADFKMVLTAPSNWWESSPHSTMDKVAQLSLVGLTREDQRDFVSRTLRRYHKEMLPDAVLRTLFDKKGSDNALYLSLLLQRFIMFDQSDFDTIQRDRAKMAAQGVNEDGQHAITRYMNTLVLALPDALPDLASSLFVLAGQRVSQSMAELVGTLLSLSSAGWREADLRGMIKQTGRAWSPIDFSLLRLYLAPFFSERGDGRIAFAHDAIREGLQLSGEPDDAVIDAVIGWLEVLPLDDPVRLEEYPRFLLLRQDEPRLLRLFEALGAPSASGAAKNATMRILLEEPSDGAEWAIGRFVDWMDTAAGHFLLDWASPHLLHTKKRAGLSRLAAALDHGLGGGRTPDAAAIKEVLAETYVALGMPDRALELYRELIDDPKNKKNAALLYAAGNASAAAGEPALTIDYYTAAIRIWEEAPGAQEDFVRALLALAEHSPADSESLLHKAESLIDEEQEPLCAETKLLACQVHLSLAEWYAGHGDARLAKTYLIKPVYRAEELLREMEGPAPMLLRARSVICSGDMERAIGDDFPAMLFYTEALDMLNRLVAETEAPECRDALAVCWMRLIPAEGYEEYTPQRCSDEAAAIWQALFEETGNRRYERLSEQARRRVRES